MSCNSTDSPRRRMQNVVQSQTIPFSLTESYSFSGVQIAREIPAKRVLLRTHLVTFLIIFSTIFFFRSWSTEILLRFSVPESERYSDQQDLPNGTASVQPVQLAPPPGYPWHEWPSSGFNTDAFVRVLEKENENGNCLHEDPDSMSMACERQLHVIPYIVKNGSIFYSRAKMEMLLKFKKSLTGRIRSFHSMLKMSLKIAKRLSTVDPRLKRIADGEFPLLLYKADVEGCLKDKPFLTWSRPFDGENCNYMWPVPSYYHWGTSAKQCSSDWDEQFAAWNSKYPWEKKKHLAVWRGSATGHTNSTWEHVPRVELVKIGMKRPDLIDAGLVRARRNPEEEIEMRAKLKFAEKIPEEDFMKYTAVIDIDGNSWSSRFGHLLCYNSVVLKVQPYSVDYFHPELKPWKHYVPINANMSNLEKAAEYVLAPENTEEMKAIIENANDWCKSKMTWTQLSTDLLWTLVAYVENLDKGNEGWYGSWLANGKAHDLPELRMHQLFQVHERRFSEEFEKETAI